MSKDQSREAKLNALDRAAEIYLSERNLPHWFQPGAATFVTFRTSDSMPKAAVELLSRRLRQFLRAHNVSDSTDLAAAFEQLPLSAQRIYQKYRATTYLKI